VTYAPTELLTVYLEARERRKVGRLAVRQRQILFEYDPAFIASGIEISPLKLSLRPGVFTSPHAIFDGLYGVFNDSLPDGWGRLLLDRTVEKHGIRRGQLTPLDRLAYVGRNGMGALSYEPDLSRHSDDDTPLALDRLAEESAIMLAGESEEVFEELLRFSGSSAGARPKIVAQVSNDKTRIVHGPAQLKRGFEHWMIKFASLQDPRDIGAIEYAYSLMARDAGVDMPETHLFRTRKRRYFGAKRFDRQGDGRIHMHSLSGLIHADHHNPSLDYNLLLRVVLVLTKNIVEVEKAYALACFNVLAHNRDDHAKNFSCWTAETHGFSRQPTI
jgi:serine/threonine-protein kinase HipA